MEENRTLTGTKRDMVEKHIETMNRRLSYLNERILLKHNSYDLREQSALRHIIWLLTLELTDGIMLADVGKTDRSANTGLAEHERVLRVEKSNAPSNFILRKVPKSEGKI